MAFNFAILAALVAVAASAAVYPPLADPYLAKHIIEPEYDPHPEYSYSYKVQDPVTGDFKSQSETRIGDAVKGQYTLADSDGTQRIVDYIADALQGFKATVTKVPLGPEAAAPVLAKNAGFPVPPVAAKAFAPLGVVDPHLARVATPFPYSGALGYNYPGHGYPFGGLARGQIGYPGHFPYHY